MSDRPTRDSMSLEEATISNMWEIAAIVEAVEPVGRIIEMGQQVAKETAD